MGGHRDPGVCVGRRAAACDYFVCLPVFLVAPGSFLGKGGREGGPLAFKQEHGGVCVCVGGGGDTI
jgi:hypothetical protein